MSALAPLVASLACCPTRNGVVGGGDGVGKLSHIVEAMAERLAENSMLPRDKVQLVVICRTRVYSSSDKWIEPCVHVCAGLRQPHVRLHEALTCS